MQVMPRRPQFRVEFYTDAASEHRWRKIAANNRIIGASSEGYENAADAIANLMQTTPGYTKVDGGLEADDPQAQLQFIPVEVIRS